MTKFIKTLIIINGLVIPTVILGGIIVLISHAIINRPGRFNPEVVNTTNTITKDGDTLLLQGLRYGTPEMIYNSKNYKLGIMPKTFDRPRKVSDVNFESGSYSSIELPSESYLNVLFLDPNYKVIRKLVDKKAFIQSITIPEELKGEKVDTTVKNIGYLIAFEDSNKDKKIDWNDKFDLYISDLEGNELFKVTNNIDILEFRFINNHRDILISYNDRSDLRDEYKIKRFAIFNISSKDFTKLTSIDKALNDVQKILK
jgi:hypothetical protein